MEVELLCRHLNLTLTFFPFSSSKFKLFTPISLNLHSDFTQPPLQFSIQTTPKNLIFFFFFFRFGFNHSIMGNLICCCGRRRRINIPPVTETAPLPPTTELPTNGFVSASAAPPYQNPNPNYSDQYPGYCLPPPNTMPPSPPYDHHYPLHSYQLPHPLIPGSRFPMMPPHYVEYQKAVTIRNEVNLKKETLSLEPDPENPNRLLVSFTFDATMPGRF